MSWYVDLASKSKESIAKRLETEQHIPADLKAAMLAQVNGLNAPTQGAMILLMTSGHLDASGGNAEFKLRQIPIVE